MFSVTEFPPLIVYPRETVITLVHEVTHTKIFITTLFVIAKNWKHSKFPTVMNN